MPKSIQASVGFGGRNLRQNVMTVQYLLDCVPASQGGPVPELAVDGIVGPKTLAAIRKFQQAHFGHADGRVDPGARTISALVRYDPYPALSIEASLAPKAPAGPLKGPASAGYKVPMPGAPLKGAGSPGYKSAGSAPAPAKSSAGGKTPASGGASPGKSPGSPGASWGKFPGRGGFGGKSF